VQKSKLLRREFRLHIIHTGNVAAWPVEAPHEARFDRIHAGAEDDRYGCRGGFGSQCRLIAAWCSNYGNAPTNQVGGQFRQPIQCIVRPTIFDGDILTFDVAGLTQTSAEGCQERRGGL
jgi:hypothetical protein